MSLQASTYIEGDSHQLCGWLNEALEAVRSDFPQIVSYRIRLVDADEVSVTLELRTSSFAVADEVAQHVIDRVMEIGAVRSEGHFHTGQTELLPA